MLMKDQVDDHMREHAYGRSQRNIMSFIKGIHEDIEQPREYNPGHQRMGIGQEIQM